MIDIRTLDELTKRLSAMMPADLNAAKEDLERNVKTVLQAGLKKLDLVTREEFEVQRAVLLRTRAAKRDTLCWKRGETTASPNELMAFNGLTAQAIAERAMKLTG